MGRTPHRENWPPSGDWPELTLWRAGLSGHVARGHTRCDNRGVTLPLSYKDLMPMRQARRSGPVTYSGRTAALRRGASCSRGRTSHGPDVARPVPLG